MNCMNCDGLGWVPTVVIIRQSCIKKGRGEGGKGETVGIIGGYSSTFPMSRCALVYLFGRVLCVLYISIYLWAGG